jgi:hypothetical protein
VTTGGIADGQTATRKLTAKAAEPQYHLGKGGATSGATMPPAEVPRGADPATTRPAPHPPHPG